jgi:hypothetical protein
MVNVRLFQRRKRTSTLAALVLLVMGTAVWWVATEKSDFERRFDRIELGRTIVGSLNRVEQDQVMLTGPPESEYPREPFELRFSWENDSEQITLLVNNDTHLIVRKEFTQLPLIERLRRNWTRTFGSISPF